MITLKWKKYSQSLLSIGQKYSKKGKIHIEVEKLNWELKKKYNALGRYVTEKKETKSVIDFSHDSVYLKKINEIIKLKCYIEERLKSKGTL